MWASSCNKNNKDSNGMWSSSSKTFPNEFPMEINKDCNGIWASSSKAFNRNQLAIKILIAFGPPLAFSSKACCIEFRIKINKDSNAKSMV
jgi:hypothetical protein